MPTVVYIAGYGRSGSTLVERVLNTHDAIFGAGELCQWLQLLRPGEGAGYQGEALRDDPFWQRVVDRVGMEEDEIRDLMKIQKQVEAIYEAGGHLFGFARHVAERYRHLVHRLFEGIFQEVPRDVKYVVDSSKTAWPTFFRPLALSTIAGYDVKVIHLVRDGRGCMWSNIKGSNQKMERGLNPTIPFAALRSAIGWGLANTAAHVFARACSSEAYCRIRYEDFTDRPRRVMRRLEGFLGVCFDEQVAMLTEGRSIPPARQIAGNRLRKRRELVIEKDEAWKDQLSVYHRLIFWLLAGGYALRYGYLFGDST